MSSGRGVERFGAMFCLQKVVDRKGLIQIIGSFAK